MPAQAKSKRSTARKKSKSSLPVSSFSPQGVQVLVVLFTVLSILFAVMAYYRYGQ